GAESPGFIWEQLRAALARESVAANHRESGGPLELQAALAARTATHQGRTTSCRVLDQRARRDRSVQCLDRLTRNQISADCERGFAPRAVESHVGEEPMLGMVSRVAAGHFCA